MGSSDHDQKLEVLLPCAASPFIRFVGMEGRVFSRNIPKSHCCAFTLNPQP